MDTLGLILAAVVTAASVQDDEGARLLFGSIQGRFSRLRLVWADAIYKRVADWVARWRPAVPVRLEVVERVGPGFKVVKRRRVVERTFAWMGGAGGSRRTTRGRSPAVRRSSSWR